jgi:hemerythrin-like domain-containing protein
MLLEPKRSFGRDAAMALGGLALGIVGSRLVPPLFAMANGALRARMGDDPFDLLVRDHRYILGTLERMREAADDSPARRAPLLVSFKRALGKHALAEEDVVYPLLYQEAGAAEAAKHLYGEHADMKIHLYQLEVALSDRAAWTDHVDALRELIGRHIREEEDVEFPRLRHALDDQRRQSVSGKIRREEALVL